MPGDINLDGMPNIFDIIIMIDIILGNGEAALECSDAWSAFSSLIESGGDGSTFDWSAYQCSYSPCQLANANTVDMPQDPYAIINVVDIVGLVNLIMALPMRRAVPQSELTVVSNIRRYLQRALSLDVVVSEAREIEICNKILDIINAGPYKPMHYDSEV